MTGERSHRRVRRGVSAVFAVAGAAIMTVDSLEHIARGFIGLSLMLIAGVTVAAAGVGLAVGLVVERVLARTRRH
ncbi:MAG: hypothetical protein ACLFNX_05075 [Spirochaetaceae bacterium]